MNNLNDLFGKITEFLKTEAKTETIIGEPFKLGDFTCVPVMSVGLGFGGGEGSGNDKEKGTGNGAGAGAGIGLGPVGFLATNGKDIQFIPARNSKGLSAAFEKLPELIEKVLDKNKEKTN